VKILIHAGQASKTPKKRKKGNKIPIIAAQATAPKKTITHLLKTPKTIQVLKKKAS